MPKVRGKFKVTEITRRHWNPEVAEVKLEAVYSGSPEDNTYSAATPSGTIQMCGGISPEQPHGGGVSRNVPAVN
jgi:hypothetical protein